MQAAIDSLPDPVLIFDLDGKVRETNDAAEATLALRPGESYEQGVARADPEVRAAVERIRSHVLSGKGSYAAARLRRGAAPPFRGRRPLLAAARRPAARARRRRDRRDARAAGRHAGAADRGAARRPGGDGRARAEEPAHLAADGGPPVRRGGRGPADGDPGRPPAHRAPGLRAHPVDHRRHPGPGADPVRTHGAAQRGARRRGPGGGGRRGASAGRARAGD